MSEDSVAHCIVEQATLERYLATLNSIVNECKLHISSEGFHVTAVDPANVAMIDHADLEPRAFDAFDSPGAVTQGININRFLEFIDNAGADEPVELNMNMETRKLEIHYGATDHSMALIDPEAIRAEPDTLDIDLPNTVVVEASDLRHAIDVCELSSEHLYVRGDVDERQIEFFGQGDTDETCVTYGDEEVIDADVQETVESVYGLEYLASMTKPMPPDAEVELRFGNELPIRMAYQTIDGALDVQMTLAPRIQSN